MSKLEVDAVEPQSGTALTLGASGDTITIPSGAIISNQGTATGFGPTGAVSWDVANIKTTGFTAVNGLGYFCNTTSAAFTVTLPATPSAGNVVAISDYAATFATNNITVNPNGNKIAGLTDSKLLNTSGIAVTFVYVDSTEGWIITDSGLQSDFKPLPYSVDFLVVAGGGAGGGQASGGGGGGGAGGYRNSYLTETSGGGGSSEASLTFNSGTVYTITVGAGGAQVTSKIQGNSGSNSSISGTGISTITSIGGGGGGAREGNSNGLSGGSGGGASITLSTPSGSGAAGAGTANQGYNGGSNTSPSNAGGAGGGGAGAVGTSKTSGNPGGDGGAGLASSITGSSVIRGGGGGGGSGAGGNPGGSGGTGGGGAGGSENPNANAIAGTANTGGGGGGCNNITPNPNQSAAGGSGVVIIRMATANYSGTTTGSPTVSTSGSDTILVYNSSGSYTG